MTDADGAVALAFHRFGPYHRARLEAVRARLARVQSLEFSSVDEIYAWERVLIEEGTHVSVFSDADVDRKSSREVAQRVSQALDELSPAVLAIPGWSHPAALSGLAWSLRNARPAVLMSESTAGDEPRRPWREWIKRRVVRLFAAALVGGAPQAAYVRALGMPKEAIFPGYDAVDNAYFANCAATTRAEAERVRGELDLPPAFFLASSRFVPRKNLSRLVEAFSRYRARAGPQGWGLVLLGSGMLASRIEAQVRELGLAGAVQLPGFIQYEALPRYYGLADAFVHASTSEQWGLVVNEAMASGLPVLVSERCGCAPDLVAAGVNGFTFDPYDVEELAGLMQRVAAMTDEQRHAMGLASQTIIAGWGPERFADGLMKAVDVARSRPLPKPNWLDRPLLTALLHRPGRRNSSA
jgi:glycosyltransferase involved in cell wall biosynthesis